MELSTVKEVLGGGDRKSVKDPALNTVLTRLEEHGEVFIELQSGETIAVHLGDKGRLDGDSMTIMFGNGEVHTFFASQIVEVWTHRAAYEG